MALIEVLVLLMFITNMFALGGLYYLTLSDKETNKKALEDLQSEVERLKRNFTL